MGVLIKGGQRGASRLALAVCFLLMGLLLASCGSEAPNANDFSAPTAPAGLIEKSEIANDADFRSKVLSLNDKSLVNQELKVYVTEKPAGVQQFYRDEMGKRGWNNVTSNIINNAELGSKGAVDAFEKFVGGDVNKKHVFGVIIVSPDTTNNPVDRFRSGENPTVPKGYSVVMTVQGATGVPAQTVTPK